MGTDQFADALALARDAARVEIFTGAGMSAESGLDTFRDAQTGLWTKVDPVAFASVDSWAKDPEPMWAWYLWRGTVCRDADPNAGHRAIADWASLDGVHVGVTTQNIDDLHERGGAEDVVHLHGSLFAYRCTICSRPWKGRIDYPAEPVARLAPPECPLCGNLVRPGVVWFGEMLPQDEWGRAEARMAAATWWFGRHTVATRDRVLLVASTSGRVGDLPEPTELSRIADVQRTTARRAAAARHGVDAD